MSEKSFIDKLDSPKENLIRVMDNEHRKWNIQVYTHWRCVAKTKHIEIVDNIIWDHFDAGNYENLFREETE